MKPFSPLSPRMRNTVNCLFSRFFVVCHLFFLSGIVLAQSDTKARIDVLYRDVDTLYGEGKYEEAIKASQSLVQLGTDYFGKDHPNTAIFLYKFGSLHSKVKQYDKAEEAYLRSLKILEATQGEGDLNTVALISNLAVLYFTTGRFNDALPFCERELKATETIFGAEHPKTAVCLDSLGGVYASIGQPDEAIIHFTRALRIKEKIHGPNHPETLDTITNIGHVSRDAGRFSEAERYLLKALNSAEASHGKGHPETVGQIFALAKLYSEMGRKQESSELYQRALAISESTYGRNDLRTALAISNLGIAVEDQGNFEEAEKLFLRALQIRESTLGPEHEDTADTLASLAALYGRLGRYGPAVDYYLRALEIWENLYGPDHPETIPTMNNLAVLLTDWGQSSEAEKFFNRILRIEERIHGPGYPSTAVTLGNLALAYQNQNRYEEAFEAYEKAIAIYRSLETLPSSMASTLHNLATLYRVQNRYEEAEPLFLEALQLNESAHGSDHSEVLVIRHHLAILYHLQGRMSEAEAVGKQATAAEVAVWRRVLKYFSENECLAFRKREFPMNLAGQLGSANLAATSQVYFKGAVIEAMNTRRANQAKLEESEVGQKLLQEKHFLQEQYQNALFQNGSSHQKVKELQSSIENLEKEAATIAGAKNIQSDVMTVGLEQVVSSLDANTALVELFHYNHDMGNNQWEDRYASVLISSENEPVFLAHGEADPIDAAVNSYREQIQNTDEASSASHREKGLQAAEALLYEKILAPLEERLAPGQTVIFSPDAQLYFVPLGMLRDTEGTAFGEKYEVRYVSSGRDLAKSVSKRTDRDRSALVLGNPTYRDNAPMTALAEASGENTREQSDLATTLRAGMGSDSESIQFRPLPGTSREMDALSRRLEAFDYKVTNLSRQDATEPSLMKQIDGHDIIHLATHGFFLSELKIGNGNRPPAEGGAESVPTSVQNPMYRSGLALSGAQSTFNLWKSGEVPPPSLDGVLMAAEMSRLNLNGTDLVVLSACETAAGDSLDGEGVMGLRRALNAAGATNVIMTLWPVNDQATVEVMDAFYEKYLEGIPAPKALSDVQRELLPIWIEKHGAVEAIARLAPFICTSVGSENAPSVSNTPAMREGTMTRDEADSVYLKGLEHQSNGEYALALAAFNTAADNGVVEAMNELGHVYLNGRGVDQNDTQAFEMFKLAADQGLSHAQISLATMYSNGRGTVINHEEALRLNALAATQSEPQAQANLGIIYYFGRGTEENWEKAMIFFRMAADQGHAQAQYNLGKMFENGRATPKDEKEAFRWYLEAAKAGYSDAQNELGISYENGRGVQTDFKEAVHWYRLAADQGNAPAQRNLGSYFERQKNYPAAIQWYELAALNEEQAPFACNALGWIYAACSSPEFLDGEKAVSYAEKAHAELPDDWSFADTLAAAYARSGDFDKAVKAQSKAISLLEKLEASTSKADFMQLRQGVEERLALYSQNNPYSE